MVYIHIDGNRSRSAYPSENEVISTEELEAIASLFDYSMEPREINIEAIDARLDETAEAHKEEHTYIPEVYSSFNDYLMKNTFRSDPKYQYTFFDLTGDGVDELLLGNNGAYTTWLTIKDGNVIYHETGGSSYLCEGNVIESLFHSNVYYDFKEHYYYENASNTMPDDTHGQSGKELDCIKLCNEQWYRVTAENHRRVETPISSEEAEAVMAKYPRLELNWKPLIEYPLDASGYTLGDYLNEKDVRVSDEELLRIYKEFLANEADDFYTHYRILDINTDGVDDLLISGDGKFFWSAWTYRFGRVIHIYTGDFWLCEDNVLVSCSIASDYHQDHGVEVETQEFLRYSEFSKETLAYIAYNKATASWQSDYYGTPMDASEVNEILEKYPRIDQGMRLISEFLN